MAQRTALRLPRKTKKLFRHWTCYGDSDLGRPAKLRRWARLNNWAERNAMNPEDLDEKFGGWVDPILVDPIPR